MFPAILKPHDSCVLPQVLSKRADSDDELQEALGPSVAPTAPRHLISSGVSYVKLQPSKDLAILASTSDETIQAVKVSRNMGESGPRLCRFVTNAFKHELPEIHSMLHLDFVLLDLDAHMRLRIPNAMKCVCSCSPAFLFCCQVCCLCRWVQPLR